MSTPVIVTSAPPNPNGDLHLGHLSGPFLGADVFQRHLRQLGHDVRYVGYSDEFSCYVTRRGEELGRGAHETAYFFGQRMRETLGLANMSHDYFTSPLREPVHTRIVQRFFLELWERGAFEQQELPAYWCPRCERHLYEAEVRGKCQFCAAPSDGFYCEECGLPQDSAGVTDARCTRCWQEPELTTLKRIVFPLDRYRDALRQHYAGRPMRPRLREYLDDMLSRPLPATTVSRSADYGVPVPLPEWSGHILDTWYSGIWGYVAATVAHGAATGDGDRALASWQDERTRIFEFIGFDCSFSHALLWPALFLAHGGMRLPEQVVTNEFYRLEGDKFSTSRGHAIWGNEFLRRVSSDELRFYLCLTGPEREQTNFFAKNFEEVVQDLLVGRLQTWAAGVLTAAAGVVPAEAPRADGPLAELLARLPGEVGAALDPDAFSPQAAAAALRQAILAVSDDRPGPSAGGADLALRLELLACLAAVSAPIMPAFADEVWRALDLPYADGMRKVLAWPAGGRLLTPGGAVAGTLPTLFPPVLA